MSLTVELQIISHDGSKRIIHHLSEGEMTRIGRAPQDGVKISWDKQISREHADLIWDGTRLHVKCLETARNPIVYNNQFVHELSVPPGDRFKLGQTLFVVVSPDDVESTGFYYRESDSGETGVLERSFSPEELHNVSFGNTERQMELLAKLPEMISESQSDEELAGRLAGLLLGAMPAAEVVAVAQFDESVATLDAQTQPMPKPEVMRVEMRPNFTNRFRPSRRLITATLGRQRSVLCIWSGGEGEAEYTISEGLDWAFSSPIRGESSFGWCLYVAGKGGEGGEIFVSEETLKSNVRFTELVAQFIGSIRQVRLLQQQKTQMSTFFSPNVISNLTSDKDVLTPAERDISVLFCDVRGFSRKAEAMAHDLTELLNSVSAALGVMANGILDRDGTIADFQGDAALGFWGWPVALEEGPIPACRAALDIYRGFRRGVQDQDSRLHGFSVGMGIVHGRAIAGQIGTTKQAKVGVFGPVVNQGSRLEGLTKQLGAPICIDETTADWIKRLMPPTEGRVRRLARVRPKGMDSALNVFGLLLPEHEAPETTDDAISLYDLALDAVIGGRWDEAIKILERLPDDDGPKRFLLAQMDRSNNQPPDGWDGAFTLTRK